MRGLLSGFLAAVVLATVIGAASPAGGVAGFGDVEADRFFTKPVQWMVDNGITTGTSPECFSPDDSVTRGQAAAFMWRMEGSPPPGAAHAFGDVAASWQQDPVSWMFNNMITTGTTATTYSPDENLTRGQLAALLHRLEGSPPAPPPIQFPDVVKAWQTTPVGWMLQRGITTGTSPTTFSPEDTVTRGQLAAFFYRYKGSPTVTVDGTSPRCGPPAQGTTGDPLWIGEERRVGDWDVAIVGFVGDATAAVLAENLFNPPPGTGNVYSLIRIRATYRGAGEGNAYIDLSAGLVGNNQLVYNDLSCLSVAPDDLAFVPNAFTGGTVEGNFCVILPASQIASGILFVEPTFVIDGRIWWAQG